MAGRLAGMEQKGFLVGAVKKQHGGVPEGPGGQGKKFTSLGNEDSLKSLKAAAGMMEDSRSMGRMILSLKVHALIQELVWYTPGSVLGQFLPTHKGKVTLE